MTTTTATNATSSASALAVQKSSSSALSMTDFLKLMTTQLQTQDPFNPMDNTQMAAQMAQFSSVAGISEMNTNIKALATELSGSRIGDAASWIGRSALVPSSSVTPLSDGSYQGQVTLPSAAQAVTINLIDANGAVVHTESLGAQAAGDLSFSWDGKDASGSYVGGGALKLQVSAKDTSGATITPTTASWAAIGGVQSPANGASKLVTPLGLIDPADAIRLG